MACAHVEASGAPAAPLAQPVGGGFFLGPRAMSAQLAEFAGVYVRGGARATFTLRGRAARARAAHIAQLATLLYGSTAAVQWDVVAAKGASSEDFNTGKATIGTGAFRFVRYARGERIELARNDSYCVRNRHGTKWYFV